MITPYLVFNGNCNDALDFYRTIFHCGEPKVLPYGDYMPEGSKTPPELMRTWVMNAAKLGKSQQNLLKRRIAALKIALTLIEKEQAQEEKG